VGYPGWHIECSAMSTEYLGDTLDIHTGGEDNIFPHHEAEIVQTEGVTDKPFVRYWVHLRHLLVDGVKMSKSKGNLYILEDILKRGYSAMDLRFFLLLSHYRSQMNFTWESLVQAHANRESLQHFYDRLEDYTATAVDDSVSLDTEQYKKDFLAALEDDINTPQAITVLLDMIKTGNTLMNIQKLANPIETVKLLDVFTSLLGLHRTHYVSAKISGTSTTTTTATIVPQDIIILTQERDRARAEKNFTRADELRDKIEKAGFTLKDTPQGTQIRKK
jgi:cysteinyl-tRNA synthetase